MCVNEFPRFYINVNMSITDLNYSDDVLVTFLTVGKKIIPNKSYLKEKMGFLYVLQFEDTVHQDEEGMAAGA